MKGITKLDLRWGNQLKDAYKNGNANRLLSNKRRGRTAYTDKFEANHPGMICKLYRYAESAIGNQSSFTYLDQTMNLKADTMSEISESIIKD